MRHDGGQSARSLQDIAGGLVLVLIAVIALYLVNHLPAAGRVGFASGTAPRLFAYGLLGLGAFIAITGFLKEGAGIDRVLVGCVIGALAFAGIMVAVDRAADWLARATGMPILDRLSAFAGSLTAFAAIAFANGWGRDRFGVRAPLAILGAIVLFAVMIRDFGLAVSGIPMVLLAATATADFRWKEALIFAIGITTFCALLFPKALGQPIPLWPQF